MLAVPAAAWLVGRAWRQGDLATAAGVFVFAASALALFVASTMCHGSRGRARRWWQRADHCAIYGLIAGTYTPFALTVLRGAWAWLALGGMWAAAGFGMVLEWRRAASPPSLAGYVAVGWAAVIAAAPIAAELRGASLVWLLVGAFFYTAGTAFYRNVFGLRHAHGTWHVFVLAGAASHGLSVAGLVGWRLPG